MKSSLDYNKNNKQQGRSNRVFPNLKVGSYLLLIFLLITNSNCYSEEFVTFTNGNSQFKIDMPSLYSNEIIKINNTKILNDFTFHNVFSFAQLSEALDKANGGEIIVVRSDLRNKHFHYRQKHPYAGPVLVLGMLENNTAPFLDDITWENLHNITISHFKINNLQAKYRNNYSWQIRNSNNVRLSNLHFSGENNNLIALKNNDIGKILGSQSGLLIKQSNNIRCSCNNLTPH